MNYMNWIIPIFLIILSSGYYIGIKLKAIFPINKKKIQIPYWIIIYIITTCIFLFRTIFAGFFLYFIILNLLFDLAKLIVKLLKATYMQNFLNKIYFHGIPILILCSVISLYGLYNINHPIIKEYQIKITTKLKNPITIGMISDLHLGEIHNEKFLNEIVDHANELNADIFIFGGDIFDEYTKEEMKDQAITTFGKIKTKYGIFYIEGNHDLLNNEIKQKFEQNKIQVLDDLVIQIPHLINLIGRKDYRNNNLGNPRKELTELKKEVDPTLPIIVLDHQPKDQKLAASLNIDLQLSGHTHAGQIFPANLFLQYGYKKQKNYQIIVSSGYGVWGFPIRTAGRSEMIKINLSN
ncbi:MAG: metallophosphoesterase [Bacilli bacterium]|nr:metallophosphoesterase [Bacilli bacterium]